MKKIVLSDKAPAPIGPYSQAVEAGGFLFCSGQIALDAGSGEIVGEDVETQTKKVMSNIEAVLSAAQLEFKNVVKTTIFLKEMADFQKVNAIYGEAFPEEPPARSTVAVNTLPKDVLVEIEVIALRS
jgi:2-iminobutanoate/2-iminopropanoate deaminase